MVVIFVALNNLVGRINDYERGLVDGVPVFENKIAIQDASAIGVDFIHDVPRTAWGCKGAQSIPGNCKLRGGGISLVIDANPDVRGLPLNRCDWKNGEFRYEQVRQLCLG